MSSSDLDFSVNRIHDQRDDEVRDDENEEYEQVCLQEVPGVVDDPIGYQDYLAVGYGMRKRRVLVGVLVFVVQRRNHDPQAARTLEWQKVRFESAQSLSFKRGRTMSPEAEIALEDVTRLSIEKWLSGLNGHYRWIEHVPLGIDITSVGEHEC